MNSISRVRVTTTVAPQLASILAVSYPREWGDAPVTMTRRPDMSTLVALGLGVTSATGDGWPWRMNLA